MDPKLALGGALLLGLGAVVLGLTRSGSSTPARGVVVEQVRQDERSYRQSLNGPGGRIRQGDAITLAAAWIVTIRLDGGGETVRASIPDIRGTPPFAVGDSVQLNVLRRGLPPLWTKTFATDVELAR